MGSKCGAQHHGECRGHDHEVVPLGCLARVVVPASEADVETGAGLAALGLAHAGDPVAAADRVGHRAGPAGLRQHERRAAVR